MPLPDMLETGAIFSTCENYRYLLWREWNQDKPTCVMIGLNPSRADASINDPTIRRCIDWADRNGFGRLLIGNLFGWRAVKPTELYECPDPVGPENDNILQQIQQNADLVLFFWGNHGQYMQRSREICNFMEHGHCLKVNKSGEPAHILYLRADSKAKPFYHDHCQ